MSFGVQNLTTWRVWGCHNLKNLFTSSMVKSFVQLKTLTVSNCDNVEEVITVSEKLVVEEEKNRKMVFPKLHYLRLRGLPNLKRFCFGNPIEFPLLRALNIEECPVLNTFHCDSTNVGKTVENEVGESSISTENLCAEIPKDLFNEKVALPMLQHLKITGTENLERLWPNQLAEDSFSKLIRFKLGGCGQLRNVFPLSMVTRLLRLDRLIIGDCDLLEEIFESQEEGSSSEVQENSTFGFPQLTHLELNHLPNLRSFFHKMHTSNWPSLKEMYIRRCDKVEIFASEDMSICETDKKDQQEIPIQQPLFWINKLTFPKVEKLILEGNNGMKEILHGQLLASDYFFKLKVLRLEGCREELAVFPSYFYQLLSLPNLESLEIVNCCFKEIVFQSEGVGVEKLRLIDLWKEKEAFQNLRKFCVSGCPKLESNLVPSSVCFRNLMTLEVYDCDGVIKLVTHSTAKSLVQLREMTISNCEKIEEIIEGIDGDHDEVKDEIIFPQLNLLELDGLPKLESFCSSGNHTFEFPSLETVVVEHCPKMKMFSWGGLNAPMLHEVRLSRWIEVDWIWEGSLNSTIQQLFTERNLEEEMQNSIEHQDSFSIPSTQST